MAKKRAGQEWPAVLLSDTTVSWRVSEAVKRGELARIGPRLYTSRVSDPPDVVVRTHLWDVIRLLFPGLVVGYRTALQTRPTPEGRMFLVGPYARAVKLPGLTIRVLAGPGALPGDVPYGGGMYLASPARALLECLSAKRVSAESPALSRTEIEEFVERRIRTHGERWANEVRDRAREIAPSLGSEAEADDLQTMIGTLLGTMRARLSSPAARARASGAPYDSDRVQRFERLIDALRNTMTPYREDRAFGGAEFYNLSFFDAYFSNFIEGTRFTVDDARDIVFEQRIPERRPKDAHDVLGTFSVVSSRHDMGVSAMEWIDRPEVFLEVLKSRHRTMLQQRPEVRSGEFKVDANQAGDTSFVAPELVTATLVQGLQRMAALERGFQCAVYMMFLVSEVHPFDDGNGRIARAMMNAELVSRDERRILIPTSFRTDYVGALRKLTRQDEPEVLIRALDRAQDFTARIDFSDFDQAHATLEAFGAFEEGESARLRMPPPRT